MDTVNVWFSKLATEASMLDFIDRLLSGPNVLEWCIAEEAPVTDAVGIKLAQFVAQSDTIMLVTLKYEALGEATYLAMAHALRTNTSLCNLTLHSTSPVDRDRINAAFVEALRHNPMRPKPSRWSLYARGATDPLIFETDETIIVVD